MTAGRGLDALDPYFGRYLPQLVLTVVATPVIVVVMWSQDWISGLTVLLTLPLIPVFMVLIGMATRGVQRRQWQTLNRLAARFADTVQGQSTLKVFGRQQRAAASIELGDGALPAGDDEVLRISFVSGFALEFLASISVAIIAVSIGFRLLDGSLTLGYGAVRPAARAGGVPAAASGRGAVPRGRRRGRRDRRRVPRCWTPRAGHFVMVVDARFGNRRLRSRANLTCCDVVAEVRVQRGDRALPTVDLDRRARDASSWSKGRAARASRACSRPSAGRPSRWGPPSGGRTCATGRCALARLGGPAAGPHRRNDPRQCRAGRR